MKNFIQYLSLVSFLLLTNLTVLGQNGEQLFKQCNTCHLLGKKSTGPDLKGVKQKWIDAGEQENLYLWVQNSTELIASGKSKLAKEVEGFSQTAMPSQPVSNEEIDAILDYIDNYVAAEKNIDTTNNSEDKVIIYTPNYEKNLTLFYWLIVLTIVLLIAIVVISGTTTSLLKSDFFKKKLTEMQNKNKSTLLLAIVLTFAWLMSSNVGLAFTFNGPGAAEAGEPWLLIENSDLYLFLTIDIVLLGVLIYLKRMFSQFIQMIHTPKVVEKTEPVTSKINQLLTNAVPIEEEHTILMNHEYDGIQELDNNLPTWWVWGFYATIIFAVVYIFNYHILKTSDLQIAEYTKEMATKQKEVDEYLSKMAMNVDENSAVLMTEESDLSAGKALFDANCIACHLEDGSGQIGPNLTDKYWIYGNDIKDVFKTVKMGTSNGMPEHNSKLNPIQIQQVSSFVLHLPEKKGKAAEGELIEK